LYYFLKVTVNDIEYNTKLILRVIKDFEQIYIKRRQRLMPNV
jgi:hypothetical protein